MSEDTLQLVLKELKETNKHLEKIGKELEALSYVPNPHNPDRQVPLAELLDALVRDVGRLGRGKL